MVTRVAAALAMILGGGCTLITDSFVTNEFSGDPFPIDVDLATGAVIVGVREPGEAARTAVIDVLAPVTVLDPGDGAPASVTTTELQLLGVRAATGALDLPRALLASQIVAVHPCRDAVCSVGPAGATQDIGAIVGANALAGDALRLRLGAAQVFVLADVGGPERDRTWACDAAFPSPYRGGGTMVIAGTEVPFGGRRPTVQACLGADPDPLVSQNQRGTDALLVLSTGIGISVLGESAYERYRQIRPLAPALDALPAAVVNLASGPLAGRRATIDTLALVAASSSSPRAPCRQVYAHHLLIDHDCDPGEDCPCEGGDTFCAVPASVALTAPTGLAMLVVPDDNPTLQALRTELRPDQPEVDGILGTDAMRLAEIDIDYPHDRILMRCAGDPGCVTRPALAERNDRSQIRGCLGELQ